MGGDICPYIHGLIRDSVGYPIDNSIRDMGMLNFCIWDSVHAYMSSFFNLKKWRYIEHEKYKNPFQPCINLWEVGLVLSSDNITWRLHTGKNAKVVYELKI